MSGQRGAEEIRVGRHGVVLHRPEKTLFPDDGITKRNLVEYYRAASRRMLPHLRGRPLMMLRFPDGVRAGGLVQKNAPRHFPEWIRRCEVPKRGGTVTHVVCDRAATLVYLADQACVTPHRWLSRTGALDHPDQLVFDLDPSGAADFSDVRWAARRLRALLDGELGLPVRLMTTGSRGLHLLVPLDRRSPFDEARTFASRVADLLTDRHPDRLTTQQRKDRRGDRIYLDIQRNGYAQTAVAPYAVRAKPGAPIAMPISATELDDPELGPRRWTLCNVAERLDHDPWSTPRHRGRSLRPAARRLAELAGN